MAGPGGDLVQPDPRRRDPGLEVPHPATTATIRTQLIAVPARIARSASRLRLHLPERWPWKTAWQTMFTAAAGPPANAP